MENKDLNTFINDKLNEGKGLRYQDEYWNDMNNLLDVHMPVSTAAATTTGTSSVKAGSHILKWTLFSSVTAAIVTAVVMYTQLSISEPSHTSQPSQTIHTPAPPQETPDVQHYSADPNPVEPAATKLLSPSEAASRTYPQNHGVSTLSNESQNSDQVGAQSSLLSDPDLAIVPESASSDGGNTTREELPYTYTPVSLPATDEETIASRSAGLVLIQPLSLDNITQQTYNSSGLKPVVSPYHRHNRIIRHIDVSPYAGIVFETGKQTAESGNITYTHPAQTQYTYGLNLECETRWISFRTGIGFSQSMLQSAYTAGDEVYDVDTHYVILNPNYSTTPSGKPVALIQRQIDSSYQSTTYTTTNTSVAYNYISIPLTLQYKMAYHRMLFMVEGGGVHHILVSKQNHTQQAQTENSFRLPDYSFQLTAGSSLRYAINSQWAVGIQYNYNLNPSGATLHLVNNAHVATFTVTRNIR